MNKIFSKIITIVFIFVTTSCSYKPIFSDKNYNFQIDELILSEMPDVQMIMQVHDELVFECPKSNADKVMHKMKETMEQTVKLNIPLIAEAAIGDNWNEAH